jgi:hypothetical protein
MNELLPMIKFKCAWTLPAGSLIRNDFFMKEPAGTEEYYFFLLFGMHLGGSRHVCMPQ